MTSLIRSQDIVDVENVVAIFVVVPIILRSFARFGEHSARVSRGLILERWIADTISGWELCRESLERLQNEVSVCP